MWSRKTTWFNGHSTLRVGNLKVGHTTAKFGGHRHRGKGDITWSWRDDITRTCLISLIWAKSPGCTCLSNLVMMMINCCGMVDRRKTFSFISSRDHYQRSSPARISDTPRAGFETKFRLCWMKLCSSDNRNTTEPLLWKWTYQFLWLNTLEKVELTDLQFRSPGHG